VNLKQPSSPGRTWCGPPVLAGLAAVGLVLALVAPASANSLGKVRLEYWRVSPRQASNVTYDSTTKNGLLTGKYNLTLDTNYDPDGDGTAGSGQGVDVYAAKDANNQIGTFCADLEPWAPTSMRVYDVFHPEEAPIGGGNTPIGIAKAWDLRRLFNQHTNDISTNDGAAAFQAAVWEIVYEDTGTYNVTSGDLSMTYYWGASSGWLDTANDWLGSLGTDTPDVGLRVLANTEKQDFAMWVPGLPADPLPEPVTMAGLVLGVGSLACYVRRRRR